MSEWQFTSKQCSIHLYLQLLVESLMSYFNYVCLLAHSGFQHILTMWVTWWLSYRSRTLLAIRGWLRSPPGFYGRLSFWFPVTLFCFVCLRPVSCLSGVVVFSGLAILNSLLGFLWRLFYYIQIVFRFITYHCCAYTIDLRFLFWPYLIFDLNCYVCS